MLAVSEASSVEASEAGFAAWWDDADEEVSNRVCNIVGELPSWLRGTLIRNGPGRWESGDGTRRYTHAFDGLAKLVSFDIGAEGVTFSTRFLRSDWFEKSKNGAFPPSVTTGPVDPPWSATEGVAAALTGQAFDNTPVNLHRLGGGDRWVAVTDAPPLMEFDPSTLETLGRIDSSANAIVGLSRKFGVGVPGFEAFSTAHPQRHPTSGETLNYHLELRPVGGPVAHIVAASSATGSSTIERRIVGSLELEALGVPGIPYVHSFGVTEHHVCLMLYPLYVPFGKLVNGRGFLPQLDWDAGRGSRLVVWDLRHPPERKPQVWRAPACWAYHVINAFEEQGTLTLDLNAYREPSIVTGAHGFAYLPNMRGGPQALAKQERDAGYLRLQVMPQGGDPTPTRSASARWLDLTDAQGRDWTYELVRINEKQLGRRHRYSYGFTGFNHQQEGANRFGPGGAVVKVDSDAHPPIGGGGAPAGKLAAARAAAVAAAAAAAAPPRPKPPSVTVWSSPTDFPSEPVFIGRPGATAEDDGVLLFLGYDTLKRESFMGVLDARDMTERARVWCGSRCCVSFHGQWIPAG